MLIQLTPTFLSAPGSLTVVALSTTALRLTWNASTGANLANYRVYEADSLNGSGTLLASPAAGTLTYDRTGLTASTTPSTKYFRVTAVDTNGNETSPAVAAGTPNAALIPPVQPTLVGVTSNTATVTVANPGGAALTAHWYRDGVKVTTGLGNAFGNYTFTGLSGSTTYSLTATSVDAAGNESAQSPARSATTSAAVTGDLTDGQTATIAGGNTVDAPTILGWDNFEGKTDGAALGSMTIQNASYSGNDFFISSVAPYAGTRCALAPNNIASFSNGTRLGFSLGGFRRRIYVSYRYKWMRGSYLDSHVCVHKLLQLHGTEPNGQAVGNFAPGVFISGAESIGAMLTASAGATTAQVSQDVSPFGDFWNSSGRGIFNTGWNMPFDTWHHFEYILTQSSAPGVADGRFVVRYNGVQRLDTGLIVTRASADRVWDYVNCPAGNQRQNDSIRSPVYVDMYHQQDGHGRVVLTNASTWAGSTVFEPQPCLSDTSYRVSKGALASGTVFEYRFTNASPLTPVNTTGVARTMT